MSFPMRFDVFLISIIPTVQLVHRLQKESHNIVNFLK